MRAIVLTGDQQLIGQMVQYFCMLRDRYEVRLVVKTSPTNYELSIHATYGRLLPHEFINYTPAVQAKISTWLAEDFIFDPITFQKESRKLGTLLTTKEVAHDDLTQKPQGFISLHPDCPIVLPYLYDAGNDPIRAHELNPGRRLRLIERLESARLMAGATVPEAKTVANHLLRGIRLRYCETPCLDGTVLFERTIPGSLRSTYRVEDIIQLHCMGNPEGLMTIMVSALGLVRTAKFSDGKEWFLVKGPRWDDIVQTSNCPL